MGRGVARLAVTAILLISFLAFAPLEEASARSCGASRLSGHLFTLETKGLSCRSARTKLRRYARSGRAPRGYDCAASAYVCWLGQDYDSARRSFEAFPKARGALRAKRHLFVDTVVGLSSRAGARSGRSRINECGAIRSRLVYNLTSRAVSCAEARRIARRWRGAGGTERVGRFTCRFRETGYEAGDIRCTATRRRVVRWQTYS